MIIFEFESACTDFIRNTECATFGLNSTDLVTGGFRVKDLSGAASAISFITNAQYELIFNFGNQTFTEQDASSVLGFNVAADGASFSSIVVIFTMRIARALLFSR